MASPAPSKDRRRYRRLIDQLDHLSALALPDLLALKAERVSQWSVGQHLDHTIKVDRAILANFDAFLAGDVLDRGRPNFFGHVMLGFGYIPRGAGRSPKGALPDEVDVDTLKERLGQLGDALTALEPRLDDLMATPGRRRHPALGIFTPSQWLRFVEVHRHHHLRIVRDIRRAAARR